MNIEIISEENDYFIIHKPADIAFEGEGGVLALLRQCHPEALGVHRLDKGTTGLMIFARHKDSQRELSSLFANKNIEKTYFAISLKKPSKKMGLIKGDLEKGRGGSYYLRRTMLNPSMTKFSSYFAPISKLRLFILRPITGQTHQIRVHLKSIASEILGDSRYGHDLSDRMYLACTKLAFEWKNDKKQYFLYPPKGDQFFNQEVKKIFLENMIKKKEC